MLYSIGHWQLRGFGFFVVEDRATGGMAGYSGAQLPLDRPEPEIGWGIFGQFQGNGSAAEATRATLNFVFDKLGWKTAISLIADDNLASQAVARKPGAALEQRINSRGIPCGVFRRVQRGELAV